MKKTLHISESERTRIQNLYTIKNTNQEYVFDIVLTENNKYLIFMDQVFVNGGDGNSIGSIWENTHIFNEIILDTYSKIDSINESIVNLIEAYEWKKEDVRKWIENKSMVVEGFIENAVQTAFQKGVIPALRWIRKQLYTGVGIVIDVVASILFMKASALVWVAIVLLDIYEIGMGDYDPQDPSRMQMPFFFLIADAMGALLTGASALAFKKAAPTIAKQGLSKSPAMLRMVESLSKRIPSLKGLLNKVGGILSQKLKGGGMISKMLGLVDKVLLKLEQFINTLLSKKALGATATGVGVLGVTKGVETALPLIDKQNKVGQFAQSTDALLKQKTGMGQMRFKDTSTDFATNYIKNLQNTQ
jgi:hypothetical protein